MNFLTLLGLTILIIIFFGIALALKSLFQKDQSPVGSCGCSTGKKDSCCSGHTEKENHNSNHACSCSH